MAPVNISGAYAYKVNSSAGVHAPTYLFFDVFSKDQALF